jgi:hypothetical protein
MLLYLLPNLSIYDACYKHRGHVKHTRHCCLCHRMDIPQSSNFSNFNISEFSHWMSFSTEDKLRMNMETMPVATCCTFWMLAQAVGITEVHPSLPASITQVVDLTTFEEVLSSAARRSITRVATKERVCVFSIVKEVSYPVTSHAYAFPVNDDSNRSIAILLITSPQPAVSVGPLAWCFIDVFPKESNGSLGKRREWFTIVLGHLASLTGNLLLALRGYNHAGPFQIVPEVYSARGVIYG